MKSKSISSDAVNIFSKMGATVRARDVRARQDDTGVSLLKHLTTFSKVGHGVFANPYYAASAPKKLDVRLLEAAIDERFEALETLADAVVGSNVRSLIVAGAPGVGKTFILDKKLTEAENTGKIQNYVQIKGSISPIGLYVTLYENRKKGAVIVLDDIDSVFNDEESLNLLKGALDSSEKRRISWMKDSSYLRDSDIPKTFEYEGQIVFITNVDIDAAADRGGKTGNHMAALLSRSVFLDLGIHTNDAIMVRIRSVINKTTMVQDLGLSKAESIRILDWMTDNVDSLRSISLRTVIQVASFMKSSSDWQKLAKVTMLKGSSF